MKKRAAIYARFSSDQQNERSCQDQIDLCRAWAQRHGDLEIIGDYRDDAVSGASTINRPGLAAMMRAARSDSFDVIIAEDLDRIARKQADLHTMRDELTFLGVSIMTVSDGTVTAMHAGLKGLMSEMFLADLAAKTKRGQSAAVRSGKIGGGRSYGYSPAGATGKLSIIEDQAVVIRRIFKEYIDGAAARDIAAGLNADRIPGPQGGPWNASTITGSRKRQNGILQNRLYVGEIVWNRQRFIKDPSTGNRVSRPNDPSEWIRVNAPELAIVDVELFERVQARREERSSSHESHIRLPPHPFSGLLKCGCCGAGYTIIGNDRIGCAGYRERGDCKNNRTVGRRSVEDRVLAALHSYLGEPDVIAEYVRAYREDMALLAKLGRRDMSKLQNRLADVTRQVEAIVDRILAGTATPALESRLPALEAEKAELAEQIEAATRKIEPIVLHPTAPRRYAEIAANLRAQLQDSAGDAELIKAVRRLVDRIEITPGADSKKPVEIKVQGLLAVLLIASQKEGAALTHRPLHPSEIEPPQYRGAMVAGARNFVTPIPFSVAA